jgi:hypothetical protein
MGKSYKTIVSANHDIFDGCIATFGFHAIENGKYIVVLLDDDRRVKLSISTTRCADVYNAIELSLINKNNGVIDKTLAEFREILGNKCYIWQHGNSGGYNYEWWDIPRGANYRKYANMLADQLRSYILTWK